MLTDRCVYIQNTLTFHKTTQTVENADLHNLHMAKSDMYRHPKCVGVNPGLYTGVYTCMYYDSMSNENGRSLCQGF